MQAEARSWMSNEETLCIYDHPPQTTDSSKKMETWSVLFIAISLIPRVVPGRQKVLAKHLLNGRFRLNGERTITDKELQRELLIMIIDKG